MPTTVIKRDGTTEPFQLKKIRRVVKAAGLTEKQADVLLKRLSVWKKKLNNNSVSSLEIRDQVLNELRSIHEPAADLFEWYQKTKEAERKRLAH